jgi:hypothetical protein
MDQRGSNTRSNSGEPWDLWLVPVLILPLAPAVALVYLTWDYVDVSLRYAYFPFENWLFLFKVFVATLEVLTLGYAFEVVRRDLPRLAAAIAVSAYLGLAYGMGADWLGVEEPWAGAVAIAMGTTGYFLGRALSGRRPIGRDPWMLGVEVSFAAIGIGLLELAPRLGLPAGSPAWAPDGLMRIGAVLVAVGGFALFARFPRTVAVAGLTGAVLLAAFPGG